MPQAAKSVRLERVISSKTLMGITRGDKLVLGEGEKKKRCGTIMGIIRDYKTGVSNYGEWVKFTGTFRAVDVNGELIESNKAFIPEPYNTDIREKIDEMKKAGADPELQIGLTVYIVAAPSSSTGYEYRTESHLADSSVSVLDQLQKQIEEKGVLALPDQSAKPVPPKSSEKAESGKKK